MLAPTLLAARRALAGAAVACAAALAAVPSPAAASAAAAAVPSAATATTARPEASAAPARAGKAARRAARRASRRAARATRSRRSAGAARRTGAARTRRVRTTAVAERSAGGATLRGSKAAVDRAYEEARSEGLEFAPSRRAILRGAAEGEYVSLAGGSWRLRGVTAPYARRETRAFLRAFAPEYQAACGEPLTVTSAMRPTSVRLRNSVAKTVHPTGIAVDLRAPHRGCRAWMRSALLGYERRGVVEATEERRPAHFHVAVLRAP